MCDVNGVEADLKAPFMICLRNCHNEMVDCMRNMCGRLFDEAAHQGCLKGNRQCMQVCVKFYHGNV